MDVNIQTLLRSEELEILSGCGSTKLLNFHSHSFALLLLHIQLSLLLSFLLPNWSYCGLGMANCEMQSGKKQICN